MNRDDIAKLHIQPSSPVRDAIAAIDRAGRVSLALVVDQDGHLRNTLTDGDVRRGLLAGLALDAPVARLLEIKANSAHPVPVTAPFGTAPATLLRLMRELAVRQIPLLDDHGRVVDIVILADMLPSQKPGMQAVVMAGGRGVRLRPLTDDTPKPMLHIDGRPVLERIVEQLRKVGVTRVHVATHYLSEKIVQHFGDGSAFGVELNYLREDKPLGTAGALSLLAPTEDRLLVMNGDIVTDIDFDAMLTFHTENVAQMTVAVRQYSMSVPYGVMNFDGASVLGVDEKPDFNFFVNAGIYVIEPAIRKLIPSGLRFDMTDLIGRMIEGRHRVVGFPIREYWLDIGKHSDYAQAQTDVETAKASGK